MTQSSKAVPQGRARRFGKFARLAGGVASNMLAEGVKQVAAGNRPKARDLLLTPGNARRLTKQLAEMRGAAMKLGQIFSMDTGDFLPRELADIMATLRDAAFAMPEAQLEAVLLDAFGPDYDKKLRGFERKPFAAASIGQVHRLSTRDGRAAVLKVQYPGVRESIDSDVDNLATLLKVSGLLPKHIDISPLLAEVKVQLREEADYEQEARYLNAFVRALGEDERFLLPRVIPSLSTPRILGMTYVPGVPIEDVIHEAPEERDRVLSLLFELLLVEMFDLRLVQTDPNFANYRYDPDTGQVVLLDFGASRRFKAAFTGAYRDLLRATVVGDSVGMAEAAERIGYTLGPEGSTYRETLLELATLVLAPLTVDATYDFGQSALPREVAARAGEIQNFREFWEAPPVDVAYIHRKIGGLFMLATRLQARVNVHKLLLPWLDV
ncbi:MAG: AarF/ABC1/UbiB kinase family protein [Luminiphilus sp.]|nr:AarF/ABC1/UbiB kinase family protein [Luminiphilus sp.]